MAVPIKNGAPFLSSPQDKSESLKPHSGSHKDEIKSEEGRRAEGKNGGLPAPRKGLAKLSAQGWEAVSLRKSRPFEKMVFSFKENTTEPRSVYLVPPAGFFTRYCLGLSSGERERRMGE